MAYFHTPLLGLFVELLRPILEKSPEWRRKPTGPGLVANSWGLTCAELRSAFSQVSVDAVVEAWRARINSPKPNGPVPETSAAAGELSPEHTVHLKTSIVTAVVDPSRRGDEALCLYRHGQIFASLAVDGLPLIRQMLLMFAAACAASKRRRVRNARSR